MPQRYVFILFIALLLLTCSAGHAPDVTRFVFDQEHLFTPNEESRLDSLFRAHERATSNEIVVVTTSTLTGLLDMQTFAASFGDSLGVGKRKKNNGVVIAVSKHLREVYMATGLGLEEVLDDDKCQRIIDSLMLPRFKEEQYFEGIFAGSKGVVEFLEDPENGIK